MDTTPPKAITIASNLPMGDVAIADGEPCIENEVKRFANSPSLYEPDSQSDCDHGDKDSAEDRPDHPHLLAQPREDETSSLPNVSLSCASAATATSHSSLFDQVQQHLDCYQEPAAGAQRTS
jgi:hypothetical protein